MTFKSKICLVYDVSCIDCCAWYIVVENVHEYVAVSWLLVGLICLLVVLGLSTAEDKLIKMDN